MDKQIQVFVGLILIRYLIVGGMADVVALAVAVAATFLNIYMNRKPVEQNKDVEFLKDEVETLKTQVSSLNIAQGIKKLGGN